MSDEHRLEMLKDFGSLEATNAEAFDHFFEKWGVGQNPNIIHTPYERLESYRYVLREIKKADPEKYIVAHKGTPFFFIGILMFDCKNFETALFYISAALSEDRRRSGNGVLSEWISTPAGQIMSLNKDTKWERIESTMVGVVGSFINDFNSVSETSTTISEFVNKFVHPMIGQGNYSIITSLYSYMLECNEIYKNLYLTSGSVDSTELILVHLFKGALIFETILKHYYPNNDHSRRIKTLGGFSGNSMFVDTFPNVVLANSKSTESLQEILDEATDKSFKTAMESTAKIRNTTGHELIWDNIFNEPDNYRILYEQEVSAILYVISRQW